MEKELKIPKISEDTDEATVGDVLVAEGDTIKKDQAILTVEDDKASVEIPADFGGKITGIKVSKGDTVSVGDVVMTVETENNDAEDDEEEAEKETDDSSEDKAKTESKEKTEEGDAERDEKKESAKSDYKEEKKGEEDEKSKEKDESQKSEDSSSKADRGSKEKREESSDKVDEEHGIPVAPLARKLARELGVNLSEIPQSGDRLTSEDVTNYAKKLIAENKTGSTVESPSLPNFAEWGETERKSLSGIRKATAENTTLSWRHIPHVTQNDKANVSGLEAFLEKQNEKSEEKITITAIILKVIGEGLNEFPDFNASIDMQQGEAVYKKYFNVGVAVDTEDGLLVPVIRDVTEKSITELNTELQEVAAKARDGKLSAEEMEGGNFTISNLGGIGGTSFTPVVFPPQVAILGVSRTTTEAVYRDGEFKPERLLPLSLSYDHRLIDGANAARFLRWICESLEQPMKLMLN